MIYPLPPLALLKVRVLACIGVQQNALVKVQIMYILCTMHSTSNGFPIPGSQSGVCVWGGGGGAEKPLQSAVWWIPG